MSGRLTLLLCCCAAAFAQSGTTVEGRVVSGSGTPVRRAVVQIRNFATPVSVETDGEGRFSIPGLPAGAATLAVTRQGYDAVSQPITIEQGQSSVSVTIKMTRQGAIYGKITDEYGDPFGQVNVSLVRRVYENGWRWQQMNQTPAGPDGTYAFGNLAAGRYYVAAADMTSPTVTGQSTRYMQTYYPSAEGPSGATAIDIAPEAEMRGIDIRLRRGRVFRVSGKVTGPETVQGASVSLVSRDSTVPTLQRAATGVNQKDGTFVIPNVPEGTYYAHVQLQVRPRAENNAPAPPPVLMIGRELVTVAGRDVDNVTIQMTAGAEISGRWRLEGSLPQPTAPNQPAQLPRISLTSREVGLGTSSSTQVSPDGTFTMRNVAPGIYAVNVNGPAGAYAYSIRYENGDVAGIPFTVGSGGGKMEVVLRTDSARLSGVARDEKGEPLLETRVSIWSSNSKGGFASTAMTDRAGTYRFQNVPPGEYRVTAWDPTMKTAPLFGTVLGAQEFLHQFDTTATTVRLEPSGQQTQDVKAIPQAAMEVAVGRLQ